MVQKKILARLNKKKYYYQSIRTVPLEPFILVDEMCDGKDYLIGDLSAAEYWHLSSQHPDTIDVYTTRRQGKVTVCKIQIHFHRTTKKKLEKAVSQTMGGHPFLILSNKETSKWLRSRE